MTAYLSVVLFTLAICGHILLTAAWIAVFQYARDPKWYNEDDEFERLMATLSVIFIGGGVWFFANMLLAAFTSLIPSVDQAYYIIGRFIERVFTSPIAIGVYYGILTILVIAVVALTLHVLTFGKLFRVAKRVAWGKSNFRVIKQEASRHNPTHHRDFTNRPSVGMHKEPDADTQLVKAIMAEMQVISSDPTDPKEVREIIRQQKNKRT